MAYRDGQFASKVAAYQLEGSKFYALNWSIQYLKVAYNEVKSHPARVWERYLFREMP